MKRILFCMFALWTLLCPMAANKEGTLKVVVISSSPRIGGNTDLLCDEFIRGASEAGNEVEKIILSNYHIDYINAEDVEYGMKRQHNPNERDDAPKIIRKMAEADIIVLASPVYFMNITGQLKTLMDRVFSSERNLMGKKFYFITACTDDDESTADCAITAFRGFTMCLPRSKEMGAVKAYGIREKGDVRKSKYMKEAYELGKNVK